MTCRWCRVQPEQEIHRPPSPSPVDWQNFLVEYVPGLCHQCRVGLRAASEKDLLALVLMHLREVVYGLDFIARHGGTTPRGPLGASP